MAATTDGVQVTYYNGKAIYRQLTWEEESVAGPIMLVRHNCGLVRASVNRAMHRNPRMDVDELMSAGLLGLFNAARSFDYRKGWRFSTYAITCIRRELSKATKITDTIHIPRQMRQLPPGHRLEAVVRKARRLCREDGRIEGVEADRVTSGMESCERDQLLDHTVRRCLATLSPLEREVFRRSYWRKQTRKQIAQALSISVPQIYGIQCRVIPRLRRLLQKDGVAWLFDTDTQHCYIDG